MSTQIEAVAEAAAGAEVQVSSTLVAPVVDRGLIEKLVGGAATPARSTTPLRPVTTTAHGGSWPLPKYSRPASERTPTRHREAGLGDECHRGTTVDGCRLLPHDGVDAGEVAEPRLEIE